MRDREFHPRDLTPLARLPITDVTLTRTSSHDGAYGDLRLSAVQWVKPLPLDALGARLSDTRVVTRACAVVRQRYG